MLEALLGAGIALAVNSLLFPPHPLRMAGRAVDDLVDDLAGALEQIAAALAAGDGERAGGTRADWTSASTLSTTR